MNLISKEKKHVYACPEIKDIVTLAPFLGTLNDALEVFNRANDLAKEYNVKVDVSDTIQVKIPVEDAERILAILLTIGFMSSDTIGLTKAIPKEKITEYAIRETGFRVVEGNVVYHNITTAALNGVEYDSLHPSLREMIEKDDYDLHVHILCDCNNNDNDETEKESYALTAGEDCD